MKYLIIINPQAGSGRAKELWPRIEQRLDELGIDYQVTATEYSGHAIELAHRFAKRYAKMANRYVMLAIGGDGTLHEVLNGLMQSKSQIPLAYLPAGSGNDFARAVGLNHDPLRALEQILQTKHATEIYVGHYFDAIKKESGYFLNNLGIGFDAAIVNQANTSKAKRRLNRLHLGSLAYLSQVMSVLYHQTSFATTLQVNGRHDFFAKTFILIASNHPYIGGGFKIAPQASVTDPHLELLVVEHKNWLTTLWSLILFARGKLSNSRLATRVTSKKLHYITTSLEFVQSDGEILGSRFMDLTLDTRPYPFWGVSQGVK